MTAPKSAPPLPPRTMTEPPRPGRPATGEPLKAPRPAANEALKAARLARLARAATDAEEGDGLLCQSAPTPEVIVGVGDRMAHLALVAGTAALRLRPPAAASGLLPKLRPASRLACERRCGRAGQCDPASPFGCGGEYCRGFEGRLY